MVVGASNSAFRHTDRNYHLPGLSTCIWVFGSSQISGMLEVFTPTSRTLANLVCGARSTKLESIAIKCKQTKRVHAKDVIQNVKYDSFALQSKQ
ncbi:hypothetical protein TVAG_123860 [Trichomonas vaginalis G3]|uniref:Uncharacterized protein n=1 Tax=Trichomonas vaginalis (strain ATCC PRA-98 / G3) TaxID=412133 RepID=A2EMX8_TRIV3|nr:hypothetical protein TVAGG3_0742700 [Trichomonas vaginalis G3]EAY05963.1 hypothetical protein TVAG_123860 [Trichomonas vaginalis G3]KAI5511992.1 hypothetical protein TVAGG3_0742700 [Trichomonas vaginalis G3]|eukprot:XP_001318186.1 hypothetical protein [Trichomonas vaginalis G3]